MPFVSREKLFPTEDAITETKDQRKKKIIHRITLNDLNDQNPEHYGLKGSATRVKRIYPPERTSKQELVYMEKEKAAVYIADILKEILEGESVC